MASTYELSLVAIGWVQVIIGIAKVIVKVAYAVLVLTGWLQPYKQELLQTASFRGRLVVLLVGTIHPHNLGDLWTADTWASQDYRGRKSQVNCFFRFKVLSCQPLCSMNTHFIYLLSSQTQPRQPFLFYSGVKRRAQISTITDGMRLRYNPPNIIKLAFPVTIPPVNDSLL